MPLKAGSMDPPSEMSKAIFDQLDKNLMSQADKDAMKAADLEVIRAGWRKLAYSIAQGITDYINANLEIIGVKATVTGNTGQGGTDLHTHSVSLTGVQSSSGIGHAKTET
ncbi:MAG: hypothetical protein A4E65_03728 [Syntrophorhabdus sp. PtaU1.Bin153]|nr:MAG: hypothetical protein A4E65_03728 [Syntrophorhabdus sp. PtaU1.Bin153]